MRPIYTTYLLYWLLLPPTVIAQIRDTLLLPEVRITDVRLGRPDSMMAYRIDRIPIRTVHSSLTLGESLLKSGILLRGYGPGVLQTAGFRGFAASQTQVLWNGWGLNHGMVGVTDLSLYPSFLMSEVVVNRGGGSAEYGNAAIGGIIEIHQSFDDPTTIHTGVGSFGSLTFGGKTAFKIQETDVSLGAFRRQTRNDFFYKDVFRFPIVDRRRENASNELTSLMMSMRHERPNRVRYLNLWLSGADSEIPGPISAGIAQATQTDILRRVNAGTSFRYARGWIGVDAIATQQRLDYLDAASNVDSRSEVSIGGVRLFWAMPGIRIQTESRVTSIDFTEYAPPVRYESAISITAVRNGASGTLRVDHDSFYGAFWSGAVGMRASHFRAQLARSFGVPTFNDLYWPLLGNRDLIPETANKAEIGFFGKLLSVEVDVPLYAARIRDGIQWIPQSDGRVRPLNVREVTSFGLEPRLSYRSTWNGVGFDTNLEANYIRSRYTKERFAGDQSVNKRVAYVPEWQTLAETTLIWKGWMFSPGYRFTGDRFTTEDERFPMPAMGLWELSLGHTRHFETFSATALWRMDNATDLDYSLIRWYPMPGRQHTFTLHIQFK